MLKNYGYNVIDMGKDVPCEDIVDTAIRENAAIIGLSALMTTTMMRMQDVVELCKEKGCKSKVIIEEPVSHRVLQMRSEPMGIQRMPRSVCAW